MYVPEERRREREREICWSKYCNVGRDTAVVVLSGIIGHARPAIPTFCGVIRTPPVWCGVVWCLSCLSPQIEETEICRLCTKMQLGPAEVVEMKGEGVCGKGIKVTVPPTRSDILHPVDVVEDVAIAYGFNK